MSKIFYDDFLVSTRTMLMDNKEKLQIKYIKQYNIYTISKRTYNSEPEISEKEVDEIIKRMQDTFYGKDNVKFQHGIAFFFQKKWMNLLLKNKPEPQEFDTVFNTCFHHLSLSIFLKIAGNKYPQYSLQALNYCYLQPNPDPSTQERGSDMANELKAIFMWARFSGIKACDLKMPLSNLLNNHNALTTASDYFNRVNQVEVFNYMKNIFPSDEWKDFKQYFPTIISQEETSSNHSIFTQPIKNISLSLSYLALQQKYDIFLSKTDTNNGMNWIIDTIDRNKDLLGIDNIYIMENRDHITIYSEITDSKNLQQQTMSHIIETLVEFYGTETARTNSKIQFSTKEEIDEMFKPLFSSIMLMNDLNNELPQQTNKRNVRSKI